MNKEQQELLNEAYINYRNAFIEGHIHEELDKCLSQEEFINEIKTDDEFAKEWGLKIEERELSLEERYDLCAAQKSKMTAISEEDYIKYNIPTKQITVTIKLSYDERFKIAYKNLELRKKLEAESAMLHYPSGHIKVMDDNNIPTNIKIESYE